MKLDDDVLNIPLFMADQGGSIDSAGIGTEQRTVMLRAIRYNSKSPDILIEKMTGARIYVGMDCSINFRGIDEHSGGI